MGNIIVTDRREIGTPGADQNRKKYIDRHKDKIKDHLDHINRGHITNPNRKMVIKNDKLPTPSEDMSSGDIDVVVVGNKIYSAGDAFPKSWSDGEPEASLGADQEDYNEFILTEDEFLALYFDGWELPNFIKKALEDKDIKHVQKGFTKDTSPSRLAVKKTYEESLKRKMALQASLDEAIRIKTLFMDDLFSVFGDDEKHQELKKEIEELKERKKNVAFIENRDVRYRAIQEEYDPKRRAVMVLILDISGSMSTELKFSAKRCFALVYWFLMKIYKKDVELRFIVHTTEAYEVTEYDFFRSKLTGGTQMSPALHMADKILKEEKYNNYNKYVMQASDGDNWPSDSQVTADIIKGILEYCQYFIYLDVTDRQSDRLSPYMRELKKMKSENLATSVIFKNEYEQIKVIFSNHENKVEATI